MNKIIPVTATTIEGMEKLTCNARDLHAFLEVGRDFSTWIKERVAKYEFMEGVDFILLANSGEQDSNAWGGHNRIDYALTLDMAKELAMVENNDRGREIRRYFIACERRAREVSAAEKSGASPTIEKMLADPRLYAELLTNLAEERDRRELLEDREAIFGNRTPYGEISKTSGLPRTKPRRACLYCPRTTTTTTITTITERQLRLFDWE